MSENTWKLQDAKARFSEVVRKARKGKPQTVTVHGEPAVVVSAVKKPGDADSDLTMAGFIERSRKYRALGMKIPPRTKMPLLYRPPFGEDEK